MSIICTILSFLGFFLMMSATPFDTELIFVALLFTLVGLVYGIICLVNQNYRKTFAIIGIVFCVISFTVKIDLDNTRNSSLTYSSTLKTNTTPSTNISSSTNTAPSTNIQSSTNTTPHTNISSTPTLKNYQQIYDEYSQKLINAGPTSSINEMATILNEGVTKMAQYMYSAKGTEGQYATYQSWVDKLYDVYMNNCR